MNREELEQSLARLLFQIFIYINDVDQQLTVADVERLNAVFDRPDLLGNEVLLRALVACQVRYTEFWKAYRAAQAARDQRALENDWRQVLRIVEIEQRAILLDALQVYARYCLRGAGLAAFSFRKVASTKEQALDEVVQMLQAGLQQPADSTPAGDPVSAKVVKASVAVQEAKVDPAFWPARHLSISEAYAWKKGRIKLRCVAVTPETHDVKTFSFVADPGRLFEYKPGQFMTLELSIDGKTVRRSYTISSSPSRPYLLQITVKRVPQGLVSNWLHDHVAPGFELMISGPHGEFHLHSAPNEKLLLVSAGSGITPVMSMLRWLADTQSMAEVVFITYVRTPADAIFERELRYLASRLGPRIQLVIMPKAVDPGQSWHGPVGGFSIDSLKSLVPDYKEREVFVCGPPGFMDSIRAQLEQHGHPVDRYHQESFGGAAPVARAAPVSTPTNTAPQSASIPATISPAASPAKAVEVAVKVEAEVNKAITVQFAKSGKSILCGADDFLLDLAEEHEIAVDSSCRAGNCGSCKVKKLEGEVDMEGQQALSEADIADGFILCCIGRPRSAKLVLEV